VHVRVLNRQRGRRVSGAALAGFVRRVAGSVGSDHGGDVTVCLVSDRCMRAYNRRFRDIDAPTDVLSFAYGPSDTPEQGAYLGDVVIAVPLAVRQARERGHSLARELKMLALHGYLHLLGYDHERDNGTMMRLQRRLERRLLPRETRAVQR